MSELNKIWEYETSKAIIPKKMKEYCWNCPKYITLNEFTITASPTLPTFFVALNLQLAV